MLNGKKYKDLLIKALNKNEVENFATGKGEYYIECRDATVPTDFGNVIDTFFYVKQTNDEIDMGYIFEKMLLKLLNGDECEIYCAVFLYFSYILRKVRIRPDNFKLNDPYYIATKSIDLYANFDLDIEKINGIFKEVLGEKKEQLKLYKEWTGTNKENGVWTEFVRLDLSLQKKYLISIL